MISQPCIWWRAFPKSVHRRTPVGRAPMPISSSAHPSSGQRLVRNKPTHLFSSRFASVSFCRSRPGFWSERFLTSNGWNTVTFPSSSQWRPNTNYSGILPRDRPLSIRWRIARLSLSHVGLLYNACLSVVFVSNVHQMGSFDLCSTVVSTRGHHSSLFSNLFLLETVREKSTTVLFHRKEIIRRQISNQVNTDEEKTGTLEKVPKRSETGEELSHARLLPFHWIVVEGLHVIPLAGRRTWTRGTGTATTHTWW